MGNKKRHVRLKPGQDRSVKHATSLGQRVEVVVWDKGWNQLDGPIEKKKEKEKKKNLWDCIVLYSRESVMGIYILMWFLTISWWYVDGGGLF